MRWIVVLILCAMSTTAYTAPFLVATKGPGGVPTEYEFTGLPLDPNIVPAQTDGSFRIDLMNLPPGEYTVQVRGKNLWGASEYSDPFTFTRPGVLGKPTTLGLSPQ